MRKNIIFVLLAVMLTVSYAHADDVIPSFVRKYIPDATKAGTAHASYMMLDLYTATLYKPYDAKRVDAPPFALRLAYHRSFSSADIVDRTISDIRDGGFTDEVKLAAWHDRLHTLIPDVEVGDTLTGVLTLRSETLFYANDHYVGKVSDPSFGPIFFALWLGKDSDEPITWDVTLNQ